MTTIDRLITFDAETPKRLAIVGDPMRDVWRTGEVSGCQEGCLRLREHGQIIETPGGAANAARQLDHWNSQGVLLSITSGKWPQKTRFLDPSGRIVFRSDDEEPAYAVSSSYMEKIREEVLYRLGHEHWDAVLVSDYEKGFLEGGFILDLINLCHECNIPVVADAKRPPGSYLGAVLKCNLDYAYRWFTGVSDHSPAAVITCGALAPILASEQGASTDELPRAAGSGCVNHVGAGDCFSAHLALGLAHGLNLEDAVAIAHAAGQVYVGHPYGRPPWPHEIRKQIDPAGGKILKPQWLAALRESISGRIVLTNGVFRVPHAGHAYLTRWARQQGDVLVVAINSDPSAAMLRPGQVVLPVAERVEMLAALEAVDWVVTFGEADPCEVIRHLKPDVLVKGGEFLGQRIPGDDMVADVRFAPPGPHERHCTDLIRALSGG